MNAEDKGRWWVVGSAWEGRIDKLEGKCQRSLGHWVILISDQWYNANFLNPAYHALEVIKSANFFFIESGIEKEPEGKLK